MLSACATVPPAAPPAAPPASPVLQAVATGAPNVPAELATPQGPATVTVLSDYISGEGQECRAYSLAVAGLAAQKLACNDGAAWHDIPPLNPGSQP